jgi:hypothetical protein
MTLTFYTLAISGCLLELLCIITRSLKYQNTLLKVLIILITTEPFLLTMRALGLFISFKPLSYTTFYAITAIHFFYTGCFLGFLMTLPLRQTKFRHLVNEHSSAISKLFKRLIIAAASFFMYSSIAACYGYKTSLQFFNLSGYSEGFMIAIIILEFVGAIGLLFRKTSVYAAMLLIADMCGAVITHYINYYHHRYTNPFVSSFPALTVLPVLLTILIINAARKLPVAN